MPPSTTRAQTHQGAVEAFRGHGGGLCSEDALGVGIHPRTLDRLRDDGGLERLRRGVHRPAARPVRSGPDLVTVELRVPRVVVYIVSTLADHDATLEVPHGVHVAGLRGTSPARLVHPVLLTGLRV